MLTTPPTPPTSQLHRTVLTAGHCIDGFDSAVVYMSEAPGAVDVLCMERNTKVPSALFDPKQLGMLQATLAPCGVQVRAVDQAVVVPSGSDMGLLKLSTPATAKPVPIGPMRSSAVTVFGYGMTESSTNVLQSMHVFTKKPLSETTCSAITSRISESEQWVCLAHGNASICHGDSGGGMIADGVLVAVNADSTFSTPAGDCRLNAMSLHLSIEPFMSFINTVAGSWGDSVSRVAAPAPPMPPAPQISQKFNIIGSVYVRGLRQGSNQTLWCAGAALLPDVLVVSAMCIGQFTQFEVYDAYACAVDTNLCQGRSRRASLFATHPSVALYESQFYGGKPPTVEGVDLAVLAVCGSPLNSIAVIDPPRVLTTQDGSGMPVRMNAFTVSECDALMVVYNRPHMVCAPFLSLITGSPLFGNMGVAAITSLMFYGRGIKGQNEETEVFTVATALAPFAKWIANAARSFTVYGGRISGIQVPRNARAISCPTISVPPSAETTSTSTDMLGAFEPAKPPRPPMKTVNATVPDAAIVRFSPPVPPPAKRSPPAMPPPAKRSPPAMPPPPPARKAPPSSRGAG